MNREGAKIFTQLKAYMDKNKHNCIFIANFVWNFSMLIALITFVFIGFWIKSAIQADYSLSSQSGVAGTVDKMQAKNVSSITQHFESLKGGILEENKNFNNDVSKQDKLSVKNDASSEKNEQKDSSKSQNKPKKDTDKNSASANNLSDNSDLHKGIPDIDTSKLQEQI